jgi:hypothetical protein
MLKIHPLTLTSRTMTRRGRRCCARLLTPRKRLAAIHGLTHPVGPKVSNSDQLFLSGWAIIVLRRAPLLSLSGPLS